MLKDNFFNVRGPYTVLEMELWLTEWRVQDTCPGLYYGLYYGPGPECSLYWSCFVFQMSNGLEVTLCSHLNPIDTWWVQRHVLLGQRRQTLPSKTFLPEFTPCSHPFFLFISIGPRTLNKSFKCLQAPSPWPWGSEVPVLFGYAWDHRVWGWFGSTSRNTEIPLLHFHYLSRIW